ncbi:ATP-binding cassette domain-containing protein [Lacrimispora brassicae]
MITKELLTDNIAVVLETYPYAGDFFAASGIEGFSRQPHCNVRQFIDEIPEHLLEDIGASPSLLADHFILFLNRMESLKQKKKSVEKITIIGGENKLGEGENLSFSIEKGEIITVMGPTGSGKSCLLADIECLAQGDTQTKRKILIDDRVPSDRERYQIENKLIAQLSQNMNFVMDLPVMGFLRLHGESRMIQSLDKVVEKIFDTANDLAGERFSKETPLTELSGGQSRALMIADTAFLSASPIVLIDEIENAGVDRKKALRLLAQEQKIVLMSTHDPILALMGDKRIIIENGGIKSVLVTSDMEKRNLKELEDMDRKTTRLLQMLRGGERVEISVSML